jgi:hypothetical protein
MMILVGFRMRTRESMAVIDFPLISVVVPRGVCRYIATGRVCPRQGCWYSHELPGQESSATKESSSKAGSSSARDRSPPRSRPDSHSQKTNSRLPVSRDDHRSDHRTSSRDYPATRDSRLTRDSESGSHGRSGRPASPPSKRSRHESEYLDEGIPAKRPPQSICCICIMSTHIIPRFVTMSNTFLLALLCCHLK